MGRIRDAMARDLSLRNLAPSTTDTYLRAAKGLAAFYDKSPEKMTRDEVAQYLIHLRERGLSPATRGVYHSGISFLFRVTLRRPGVIVGLPHPKVPKHTVRVLTGGEVLRLMEAMPTHRHRAVFGTTYGCGLRISETCSLHIEDIESDRRRIHVRQAKGGKDRYVPLGPALLEVLRNYYRAERPQPPLLFPGRQPQRPMTTRAFYNVLTQTSARLGFAPVVTPHQLRHTYATHQLEQGLPLRVLQIVLGHADPKSTAHYLNVSGRVLDRLPSPLETLAADHEALG